MGVWLFHYLGNNVGSCCGNGYIFYNNDDNNIYRFDNNQLAIISNDIAEWLVKAKPNNVRFAHDIRNNRLLFNLFYDITI